MRIIFMGNPEFAVPSLKQIASSDHKLLYVVSNPAKPFGRGKKFNETAIGLAAKNLQIPVLQPNNLKDINFQRYISKMQPDIFVVVAYKILPNNLLSIPRYGAVNLHPSKLPKYRGAAPIQWALLNGDKNTAVSIIDLNENIDSGSVLMQKVVKILDNDDFGSLSEKLSELGAKALVETLNKIENGSIAKLTQNEKEVTLAPKIKPNDLIIDWKESAKKIRNKVRAFSPYPGAYTLLSGRRLKIYSARLINKDDENGPPGQVLENVGNELIVQTGNDQLEIIEVQMEGKKRMDSAEFLRGVNIKIGTVLGD